MPELPKLLASPATDRTYRSIRPGYCGDSCQFTVLCAPIGRPFRRTPFSRRTTLAREVPSNPRRNDRGLTDTGTALEAIVPDIGRRGSNVSAERSTAVQRPQGDIKRASLKAVSRVLVSPRVPTERSRPNESVVACVPRPSRSAEVNLFAVNARREFAVSTDLGAGQHEEQYARIGAARPPIAAVVPTRSTFLYRSPDLWNPISWLPSLNRGVAVVPLRPVGMGFTYDRDQPTEVCSPSM